MADWLAPIIVWFLVITMGLAIAVFLLGEKVMLGEVRIVGELW